MAKVLRMAARWLIFVVAWLVGRAYKPAKFLAHYLSGRGTPMWGGEWRIQSSWLAVRQDRLPSCSHGSPEEVGWSWDGRTAVASIWDRGSRCGCTAERCFGAFYVRTPAPQHSPWRLEPGVYACRDWYDWHATSPNGDRLSLRLSARLGCMPPNWRADISPLPHVSLRVRGRALSALVDDELWLKLGGRPFLSYFQLEVVE